MVQKQAINDKNSLAKVVSAPQSNVSPVRLNNPQTTTEIKSTNTHNTKTSKCRQKN